MTYQEQLQSDQSVINQEIVDYMNQVNGEDTQYLADAMSYSMEVGGKRLRPILVLEFCRMCGGNPLDAIPFACALEMIHTSSLIHDDMECMDNDSMRRGKPATHTKFGENFGLLSGDALMAYAFEVASQSNIEASKALECIYLLATETGIKGMLGGQTLDEENETREGITLERLNATHKKKTGALIQCACEMGCVVAGGSKEQREAARTYGEALGLAFQIEDDILDIIGDEAILGKNIGSDAESNKTTYVTLLGLEESKVSAQHYTEKAYSALNRFEQPEFLKELTKSLLERES